MITRSDVEKKTRYQDYRENLRWDFIYSCAYCTITESEASSISFEIDHYIPETKDPSKKSEYTNLMYSCSCCNGHKNDYFPPEEAIADGNEYFKADIHDHDDHFDQRVNEEEIEITPKSDIGDLTIDVFRLNRKPLRHLRAVRQKIYEDIKFATHGVSRLVDFPIDRLPPSIRGKAREAIDAALTMYDDAALQVEDALRAYARSPLNDPDPAYAEETKKRAAKLRAREQLYPGTTWRRHGKGGSS